MFIANVADPLVLLHDCTGVLLNSRVVVVPASCVYGPRDSLPLVRIGSYDVNIADKEEEKVSQKPYQDCMFAYLFIQYHVNIIMYQPVVTFVGPKFVFDAT